MRMNSMLRRLAAALLAVMMLVPSGALAEAVQAGDAAIAACQAAGGKMLAQPRAVKVESPYGTQSVVLRSAPSDSYDAVAVLLVGQEITVVGEAEAFCFVLLADGSMGWLATDEVK